MGKAEELKEKLFSNVLLPNIGILLLAAGGEMRNQRTPVLGPGHVAELARLHWGLAGTCPTWRFC